MSGRKWHFLAPSPPLSDFVHLGYIPPPQKAIQAGKVPKHAMQNYAKFRLDPLCRKKQSLGWRRLQRRLELRLRQHGSPGLPHKIVELSAVGLCHRFPRLTGKALILDALHELK